MKKRIYWGLGVLVLLLGIVGVLMMKRGTGSEPITVYKHPSDEVLDNIRNKIAAQQEQEIDDSKRPPPGETKDSGYWHGDHWHKNDYIPESTGNTFDHIREQTGETANLDELIELKAQIDSISARIQEKYPEFQELGNLTPEQLDAIYPTEADRQVLLERSQNFLKEFLQEIKDVFAESPYEIRQKVFKELYAQFTQSWGFEVSETIVGILYETLEE